MQSLRGIEPEHSKSKVAQVRRALRADPSTAGFTALGPLSHHRLAHTLNSVNGGCVQNVRDR